MTWSIRSNNISKPLVLPDHDRLLISVIFILCEILDLYISMFISVDKKPFIPFREVISFPSGKFFTVISLTCWYLFYNLERSQSVEYVFLILINTLIYILYVNILNFSPVLLTLSPSRFLSQESELWFLY